MICCHGFCVKGWWLLWAKPSRHLSTTQALAYLLFSLSGIGNEEWNRKRKLKQCGFKFSEVKQERKKTIKSSASPLMGRPMPSQVLNTRWQTELKPFSLLIAEHDTVISLVCLCSLSGYAHSQTLVHPPSYLWGVGEDVVWETERSWMLCKCCSGVTKTFIFRNTDLVTIIKQHHRAAVRKIILSQPSPEQLQRKVANAPIIRAERELIKQFIHC